MNKLLKLRGRFETRGNMSGGGGISFPKEFALKIDKIEKLCSELQVIAKIWEENTEIEGALVSAQYRSVVAKSNRMQQLLAYRGHAPNDSICGAKFKWDVNDNGVKRQHHVFTHYLPTSVLLATAKDLLLAVQIAKQLFSESFAQAGEMIIANTDIEKIIKNSAELTYLKSYPLAKSKFLKILRDCWFVDGFYIDKAQENIVEESLITIYKTKVDTQRLMKKFGLTIEDKRIFNQTTLRLYPEEIRVLMEQAPYLIAMSVVDITRFDHEDLMKSLDEASEGSVQIPDPTNEPIIGVIDTLFNDKVYFRNWVDYRSMIPLTDSADEKDTVHGTAVDSIIVDGPAGNPHLEDGCGRFRVRHFGVALASGYSSFDFLKMVRRIVADNQDIKVWNLSLGSIFEIKPNFISPEGAALDRIQNEFDVIFIVAGTNKPWTKSQQTMKLGAPADSLNSLVVNAVDNRGYSAPYTRRGPVLSFFKKPDVSYYGGAGKTPDEKMCVCANTYGAMYMTGTSFAAPWIARKMAYLIYLMGLSREEAKALIIDSAVGWQEKSTNPDTMGFGVVPIHISEIINTNDDEIRFLLSGETTAYETYTFRLPVPVVQDAFPYFARATLVYFPWCERLQGVDYTTTEMDLHFGRIKVTKDKTEIKTINHNRQGDEGRNTLYEENARKIFRKWDNVKFISDTITPRAKARKTMGSEMWGLSIKTKERLASKHEGGLRFGVVVTLKEMNGKNRYDLFKQLCIGRSWIVDTIDVDSRVELFNKAEDEIELV